MQRQRTRAAQQRDARARARAMAQQGRAARGAHQPHRILGDRAVDFDGAALLLCSD